MYGKRLILLVLIILVSATLGAVLGPILLSGYGGRSDHIPSNDAPPELRKGVKVFIRWTAPDAIREASLVEEVRGNWVRVKAETSSGAKIDWVNFSNVVWYTIRE